ncbi:hypothetical protein [Nonomuraea jiangxiensis]|uniref:Leucine rich repeat-containing protein n=1 Tax=Nonomuraea jiangxiensis TaxID=633440 RepID=A0A1G8Q850_9ACTN|nr:hypothetical protein [Nonomuraea jiangxiensis]SDJ00897.1 hypothetical protein SAMN05421869_108159 [Nonomuraea jiangxiensis]
MDDIRVTVIDGPFTGFEALLTSHEGDRVLVHVIVFGRQVPLELHPGQVRIAGTTSRPRDVDIVTGSHAALRDRIAVEHDRLAETEAFRFFLDRVGTPECDPAAEWDGYVAHRDEVRARAEARKQAALERFGRELAGLPADEARRVVDTDPAYWLPGRAAAAEQRERAPEPDAEQRLLAAILGEAAAEGSAAEEGSPVDRAGERLERARMAAEDRDYERWEAARSEEERRAGPSRGNPSRYAYARAAHADVSLPEERGVELAIRSTTGISDGPIPPDALTAVDGLRLDLYRPADLSPLAQLPNLRWLALHSAVAIDVAALASILAPMRNLRDLTVEAPVDDLGPLARLTQVANLTLDGTLVTDLSPLAAATHLRDLSVCDGPLEDLTPLAGLRLTRLFVYRTRVRDLSPLAGMETLQVLGLVACPVRDLSVVTTLPALHFVNLRHTGIADLGDLPERVPGVTFEGVGELAPAPFDPSTAATTAGPLADEPAAALLAEFHAAGDDWRRKGRLERAMLAGRRLDLVQPIVKDGTTVAGLFLRDGIGDVPFPDNPWDIPADDGLPAALTRVWAPVAELAPRFVAAVRDRTLALALLSRDDGTTALGYLAWYRDDDGSGALIPAPDSLDRFADPAIDYHLSVVVGAAPHHADPTARVPLLAGPVPRPIRDFWAIHHVLKPAHGDSVGGALARNTLEFFQDDTWSMAAKRLGGLPPDRFIHSVGRADYDDYVLDLDVLDGAGNPVVATWAFKEWEVGGHKQFWDWLDSTGTDLIFGP